MRRLIAYLTALILALSCMAEPEQGGTAVDTSLEGAPVTITFSVPDIPVLPATKSLEDGEGNITDTPYLDPDKMYVVVCGGTQSIKYIRKAKLKEDSPKIVEVPEDKYPVSGGSRTVSLYEFEVQLDIYDFPRTIHFLGNVDENQLITGSYTYNSLPNILSYDNKQAYWQRLDVPYIQGVKQPDGSYEATEETQGFFQYIPLIRNYAKIQVTNAADNFQLYSYAVIFSPERGSIVPYRSNEGVKENRFDFNLPSVYPKLSGYEKCTFEELRDDIKYLGNMPDDVALSDVIPSVSDFMDPDNSQGRVLLYDPNNTESGFYIYERGIPNDKIGPTFIIICGKFESDDNWYYYRLDLMESRLEGNQTVSRYYPIYRNFRYNIQLNRISSEGLRNPEAAINSTTVQDISADFSMRHLSDISNGTTRLVVEPFMTRTYSGPAEKDTYYELYARFYDKLTSAEPNLNPVVKVELEPMTDNSDDILILYDDNYNPIPSGGYFFPEAVTEGVNKGVRTIRFNTVEPRDVTLTQKIKITGIMYGELDLSLYREVEITLQKKQPLTVSCPNTVEGATNIPVDVCISIPAELPESMFPLEFIVEPEDLTLTPDITKNTENNINMPVRSGRSIAKTEPTPAFYYLRTLTWDEYSNLTVENGQRTFHCYFKTNRDYNATTIWVYNEYFDNDHAYASFENTELPLTLTCTNPVLAVENTPITLELTIPSNIPESYFPLEFIIEPERMTIKSDNSDNLRVVTGPSIATDEAPFKDTDAEHFIRTLDWNEYSSLPVTGKGRTFSCDFKSSVGLSATTIWVYNEHFYKRHTSFGNTLLTMTLTCTDPVLSEAGTPITLEITVPSNIPESYFPLTFSIEPENGTITSVDLEVLEPEPYHFERILEWNEYKNLTVTGNKRAFSCNFKSSFAESATTIWVSNQLFNDAKVSFRNIAGELTDHFWVEAIGDCTVKLNYAELQFKRSDNEVGWQNYTQNSGISLPAGERVSFKCKPTKTPQTRTSENAFKCTGGDFKVGGNFASLMVGDNYPDDGPTKKGDRFINFFKGHTNLKDASELVLPMTTLSENAYKSMFDSCPNLVSGPTELPATTLGKTCYRNMFYDCTNLENAPVLPAKNLNVNNGGAYQRMFYGCSKLDHIEMYGTTFRKDAFIYEDNTINPYSGNKTFKWCDGVAASGEIWMDKSLESLEGTATWNTTWGTIIPDGWTVKFVVVNP